MASLCLVKHAWYDATEPWLWQKIEVRLPRRWLALFDEVAGGEDQSTEDNNTALAVEQSIHVASKATLATATLPGASIDEDALQRRKESERSRWIYSSRFAHTTCVSRSKPRRLRAKSKSPARWKIMRTISGAVQNVMELNEPGFYGKVPFHHSLENVVLIQLL